MVQAEMAARLEDEDRKRRDVSDAVEGITRYSDSKKRFLRKIKARDVSKPVVDMVICVLCCIS